MLSRFVACMLVLVLTTSVGILAGGGSRVETPSKTEEQSPEEQAAERYNQGLASRDAAWKMTQKLENAPAEKRAKLEKKIGNAYKSAIRDFKATISLDPSMHQAYGSLGYAYRQTGDYEAALGAYNAALELNPRYAEAIEYRAEAYLGLNRVEDAKMAHAALRKLDPGLGDQLLDAMRAWVTQRRGEGSGAKVGALDAFERWVDQQERHGETTTARTEQKSRSW